MDRQHTLAVLHGAYRDFEGGRYAAVIESIERLPGDGGDMGRSLGLASRGLLLEQMDEVAEAVPLMERAFEHSVPLPALLSELAGFFWRTGRDALANHAFLVQQLVAPGMSAEQVRALPARERALYATWGVRSSPWADRQDLYGMAPFKSALVERIGPDAAAIVLSRMTREHGTRVPGRRPLVQLIDHAREHGQAYEELIAAGPATSMPLPHRAPRERKVREMFACILEDVVVHARSNFLLTRERALLDVQDDALRHRPVDLSVDPLVVAGDPEAVVLVEPRLEDVERMTEAVWLSGVHSPAFGHWIMEFLPKVWALMSRAGFGEVPILVDEGMPGQHLEALRCFVGDRHPIRTLRRDESVRVARLWVSSVLVYLPIGPLARSGAQASGSDEWRRSLDHDGFRRLIERVQPVLTSIDATGAPPRIYLARKPGQHRRLVNAAVLEEMLAAKGFVTFDFDELPFREQLRLVRGAEQVVAAGGSASLTTIFGRPGLRVAVMTPRWGNVAWLAQASRALDHELTVLVGTIVRPHPSYEWMSDYEIDPTALSDYLAGSPGSV
jgi:capsular polysaccharide biosynthesis protein